MNSSEIKKIVHEKYTQIALQSDDNSCCGGTSCCGGPDYSIFSESYDGREGYNANADMGLGCGIPVDYAGLKAGQDVLDLGSGAGNDCFVARAIVGEEGSVTGLDFSEAMLQKANENLKKTNYTNVTFVKGEIENMPFADNSFDVVLSNCVLNLVPDKAKAFSELKRVLRANGHFCISDVVIKGQLSPRLQKDAEMYAGCVSGAMQVDDYLELIKNKGFNKINSHKLRKIEIPLGIIANYLDSNEIDDFLNGITGLFSITISAEK